MKRLKLVITLVAFSFALSSFAGEAPTHLLAIGGNYVPASNAGADLILTYDRLILPEHRLYLGFRLEAGIVAGGDVASFMVPFGLQSSFLIDVMDHVQMKPEIFCDVLLPSPVTFLYGISVAPRYSWGDIFFLEVPVGLVVERSTANFEVGTRLGIAF